MYIASIGIDLGKTTFHLVALGEQNKVLVHKKFSRPQLLGLDREPAGGAHWSRGLRRSTLCGSRATRTRSSGATHPDSVRQTEGYFADITIFESATIQDKATYEHSTELSEGRGRPGHSAWLVARDQNARHQYSCSADGWHLLSGWKDGFLGCSQSSEYGVD